METNKKKSPTAARVELEQAVTILDNYFKLAPGQRKPAAPARRGSSGDVNQYAMMYLHGFPA